MNYRNIYETMTPEQTDLIDAAWTAISDTFKDGGCNVSGTDAAEELVTAITKFFVVSGNTPYFDADKLRDRYL